MMTECLVLSYARPSRLMNILANNMHIMSSTHGIAPLGEILKQSLMEATLFGGEKRLNEARHLLQIRNCGSTKGCKAILFNRPISTARTMIKLWA